jgi:hypothetical protein
MGAFIGGATGGLIYGELGAEFVFLFAATIASTWAIVAIFMNQPKYLANMLLSLEDISNTNSNKFATKLLEITGIEEVKLHLEEGVAYLKVDNKILHKENLQSLLNDFSN